VARTGGIRLVSEFVGDATLANLAPDLLVSATRAGAST